MKYYIININTFATTDKSKIAYLHKSMDETKYIIVTNETLDGVIAEFESKSALLEYTVEYPSVWVGDNQGVTEEEVDEIKYIEGI